MTMIRLPEPFQRVLEQCDTAVIDYKSTNDHEWLKNHGFDLYINYPHLKEGVPLQQL